MKNKKVAIITGITGQDGAYLSQFLLTKNYEIVGLIWDYDKNFSNLDYLNVKNKIIFEKCDLLSVENVKNIFEKYKPNEVYNFAAQSIVKLSVDIPVETLNFNIMSVVNMLEAIRITNKYIKFFQASSCEMFGKVENLPATEETILNPLNPYAVSKVSAQLIVQNYRKMYDLFVCCGILFHHESYLRGKDFFVKKIIQQAVEIKKGKRDILKVGNLDVKRDFGYAPEYVKAMWLMLQQQKGDDFIICSGKSISLKEIIFYIFDKLKISKDKIVVDKDLLRKVDIQETLGDCSKNEKILNWNYKMSFFDVLDILIEEENNN